MKIFYHKKLWRTGAVQIHVETPPITLIKSKNDVKLENDCAKIKVRRDPTSENSCLYEFKMALFDNREPEEFLLLVHNFKVTLKALGALSVSS